jgi:hypothetical protein
MAKLIRKCQFTPLVLVESWPRTTNATRTLSLTKMYRTGKVRRTKTKWSESLRVMWRFDAARDTSTLPTSSRQLAALYWVPSVKAAVSVFEKTPLPSSRFCTKCCSSASNPCAVHSLLSEKTAPSSNNATSRQRAGGRQELAPFASLRNIDSSFTPCHHRWPATISGLLTSNIYARYAIE